MDNKIYGTVERIIQFLDYKNISKREFASKVGISHSLIGKSNSIGSDKLERILSEYPELNPVWLLTGNEDMIKSNTNDKNQGGFEVKNQENNQSMDKIVSTNNKEQEKEQNASLNIARAFSWLLISGYAEKNKINISNDMFSKLASIYRTIAEGCEDIQALMDSEMNLVIKAPDITKNSTCSQERCVQTLDIENIIEKYVLMYKCLEIENYKFAEILNVLNSYTNDKRVK